MNNKAPISTDQQRMVNEEMFRALDESNYAERIDLCLQKGAQIDALNGEGKTLLMRAVWKESPARVRYLINRGANVFVKDPRGRTAYDLNLETRDVSSRNNITQQLLSAMPDGRSAPANQTPAAQAGQTPAAPKASEDILLSPPLNVKNRKKPGGCPMGGFKL